MKFNKPKSCGNLTENFQLFHREVKIYFQATKAYKQTPDKQVEILLNLLGTEAYKLYNNMLNVKEKSIFEILRALEDHCTLDTNEFIGKPDFSSDNNL